MDPQYFKDMANVLLQTRGFVVPLVMIVLGTGALVLATYRAGDSWFTKLIPATTVGVRLSVFGIAVCIGNDLLVSDQYQLRIFLLVFFCGCGATVVLHRFWMPPKYRRKRKLTGGVVLRFVCRQICLIMSVAIGFVLACIAVYRVFFVTK